MGNPFKKMRGINDRLLGAVLDNHAGVLKGIGVAVTVMLRERRLLLTLHVVEVAAIVWLVLR